MKNKEIKIGHVYKIKETGSIYMVVAIRQRDERDNKMKINYFLNPLYTDKPYRDGDDGRAFYLGDEDSDFTEFLNYNSIHLGVFRDWIRAANKMLDK